MRFKEFYPDHLEEAMPNWAKKIAPAAALGLTAVAGGNLAYQGLSHGGKPQVTIDLDQAGKLQQPKIKADPELVKKMMSILKTEAASDLVKEARAAGMKGRELAQFLAQCAHESVNFTTLKEFGGKLDFKKYDIRFNPEKAKRLGNIHPGDGAKYIGRGFIQLTGRDNYRRAGKALGLPLEEQPELVEHPDVAAKVAVWFWKNRVHPKIHDYSNTRAVTKPINSGLHDLDNRHENYKAVAQILGVLNWPGNKA